MAFNINVKISWTIFFNIPIALFLFWFTYMFILDSDLAKQFLIIFLPFFLLLSYLTVAFNFFRSIKFEKDYLLLHFGPQLIYKKYYYKDMKDIRYATKDDLIPRGHPAFGNIEKTVVISFLNGKILFISIEKTSEFYRALLKKMMENHCKIDGLIE